MCDVCFFGGEIREGKKVVGVGKKTMSEFESNSTPSSVAAEHSPRLTLVWMLCTI